MSPLSAPLAAPPAPVRDAGALWVAFSGGLDSTVLLHALRQIAGFQSRLHAVHVHHGLQPQADAWAAHCAALCRQWEVPLEVRHVQVPRDADAGPEAAARHARHAAFAEVLGPDDVLIAAHHQDDQAETFLLRALRASGPEGLGAMRPLRRFAQGWLWRPWLAMPRDALKAYALSHDLAWIEDASNADTRLDRNFLRHQVLPLLRQRWPQADALLARSAALSAQTAGLMIEHDAATLALVQAADPQVLSVGALLALTPARRARAVRHWIAQLGLPPLPARGVEALEASLLTPRHDAQARFDWDGVRLRRWRDQLHAGPVLGPLPADWQATWDGSAALQVPGGGHLQLEGAARFETPLLAGARQGGERIQLPGRQHHHALKHVLQELGIPPWERQRLPVLRDVDGTVLAAGDRVQSATLAAWLHERNARLQWRPAGRD